MQCGHAHVVFRIAVPARDKTPRDILRQPVAAADKDIHRIPPVAVAQMQEQELGADIAVVADTAVAAEAVSGTLEKREPQSVHRTQQGRVQEGTEAAASEVATLGKRRVAQRCWQLEPVVLRGRRRWDSRREPMLRPCLQAGRPRVRLRRLPAARRPSRPHSHRHCYSPTDQSHPWMLYSKESDFEKEGEITKG